MCRSIEIGHPHASEPECGNVELAAKAPVGQVFSSHWVELKMDSHSPCINTTSARSTPMTYVSGRNKRQYVVVTAGGGHQFGVGDYVSAFALTESR